MRFNSTIKEVSSTSLIEQFGLSVDNKLIELSDTLFNVGKILDNIIFKPIVNSFDNNIIDVTPAIKAELDYNNWLYLITEICHNKLMITKPSTNSIKQFVDRLNKNDFPKKFQLKKNLQTIIYIINNNYFMKFIIL